jgi:hypothetical protein
METESTGVGDDGAVIGALGNSYRPSSCCDPALNCNPAVELVVLQIDAFKIPVCSALEDEAWNRQHGRRSRYIEIGRCNQFILV